MQLSLGLPLFLEVAQPGQSPRLGTEMPLVRIQPSRPNSKETRKVGVLIRFEPGDVLTDVGVQPRRLRRQTPEGRAKRSIPSVSANEQW